ncbi:hypothetical protein RJ639_016897 [Escallonia herrerae]|uniref:Protein kinase domain-containing protein n=1 Tax=Escallonia herrerae TaxID=1293975 RepID=A0AA88VDV6_9ASTE|nr:hypothetical protein RJ639_016897 [Escallonia herrerae]
MDYDLPLPETVSDLRSIAVMMNSGLYLGECIKVMEGSDNVEVPFKSALKTILLWDSTVEAGAGINKNLLAVDDVRCWMDSTAAEAASDDRSEADNVMSRAMARLKHEFENILTRDSDPRYSTCSSSLTDSSSYELHYEDYTDYDLPCPETISDLRSIAVRMNSGGYLGECVKVYSSARKALLNLHFHGLGVQRLNTGDVRRMEWQLLDAKIKEWVRAVKICVRIIFTNEWRLCKQIFEGLGRPGTDGACFRMAAKDAATHLFQFTEAIIKIRPSPERPFRILDIHEALSDLLPDLDVLFPSLRIQVAEVLIPQLSEVVREVLQKYEEDLYTPEDLEAACLQFFEGDVQAGKPCEILGVNMFLEITKGHEGNLEEFSLEMLLLATYNFSEEYIIGIGSYGPVYLATLNDDRVVAIKRAKFPTSSTDTGGTMHGEDEDDAFLLKELKFLSRLNHRNLARLLGFCVDSNELVLVSEYTSNGSLYDHLHKLKSPGLRFWPARIKVALDVARGIEYLHTYVVRPIIHRDIKSSNVWLDATWTARVSDFGLLNETSHLSFDASGFIGYMDPEHYSLQRLTTKSDVYSFGVLLLELLSGSKVVCEDENGVPRHAIDFVVPYIVQDDLYKVLDPEMSPPTPFEIEAVVYMGKVSIALQALEGSSGNVGVAFQSALNTVLHWDSAVAAAVGINKYLTTSKEAASDGQALVGEHSERCRAKQALQVMEGSDNVEVAFKSASNTILRWDSTVAAEGGINKYLLAVDDVRCWMESTAGEAASEDRSKADDATSTAMARLKHEFENILTRDTAPRMDSGGYLRECVEVHSRARKALVNHHHFNVLGVERLSTGDVRMMEWQLLDAKIKEWIRAVKVWVGIFTNEWRLCKRVFEGLGRPGTDGDCFRMAAKDAATHLFNSADAIIKIRPHQRNYSGF